MPFATVMLQNCMPLLAKGIWDPAVALPAPPGQDRSTFPSLLGSLVGSPPPHGLLLELLNVLNVRRQRGGTEAPCEVARLGLAGPHLGCSGAYGASEAARVSSLARWRCGIDV